MPTHSCSDVSMIAVPGLLSVNLKMPHPSSLQLRDRHGNSVEAPDVSVRVNLVWPEGQDLPRGHQELPELELAERSTQESDAQGRVFFGDVFIAEGTGKVEAGASEPSMELDLLFSATLPSGCVILA